jgi:hypothetical protein
LEFLMSFRSRRLIAPAPDFEANLAEHCRGARLLPAFVLEALILRKIRPRREQAGDMRNPRSFA